MKIFFSLRMFWLSPRVIFYLIQQNAFFILDVLTNDSVSVYCDVDKKCRKGFTKHFEGRKYFLGNGKACFSRWQLFEKDENNENDIRYITLILKLTLLQRYYLAGCSGEKFIFRFYSSYSNFQFQWECNKIFLLFMLV